MKITVLIISLFFAFFNNCIAQANYYPSVKFTPSPTKLKQYDPSVLLNNGSSPTQPTQSWTPPVYQEPVRELNPAKETRVTAYYEDSYGANVTWKHISLKVTITTNNMGKDEIAVIAYMNESGYWTTVSYGSVTKTYGEITKEFSYQTYVSGKTVYFNI